MDNINLQHFMYNYKQIVVDEIALEGLAGIGVDQLWKRIKKRISSSITEKMKIRFWNFIVNSKCILFYKLPEPAPRVHILDRFMIIDEDTGQLKDPEDYIDGPYEYHPASDDHGSCIHYKTRVLIPNIQLQMLSYQQVLAEYGDKLVMVASVEERWHALAPHMPLTYLSQLTPVHYCILELVGKGRENGQMTVGKTNLTKIVKEPKLLFYNRKHLQQLDLIRTQCITQVTGGRGTKSLLLRLKRFHRPSMLTMPKVGKLHDVIQHLLKTPDYSEETSVVLRNGLITQQDCKRLRKTINVFKFAEKLVEKEGPINNKSKQKTTKKRIIALDIKSDESSDSDEGTNETVIKCQYKVGMSLLRQAYERFLDVGLKGVTQLELSQLLGIEFYTSRTICRIFKAKNIIREFLEDKGKQRTARYIAVASTGEMDVKYAEEIKKIQEFYTNCDTDNIDEASANTSTHEDEVPKKKMKLSNDIKEEIKHSDDIEQEITEVKVLDGYEKTNTESLLHSMKTPTLRQLRIANGLLKITREKRCISGYQTLSTLVSKEICEPPMDAKAMKSFVQKLVTDGQLKILKLKWPGLLQKYTTLICAPSVHSTDPIIKAKYKEISIRACTKGKKVKLEVKAEDRNASRFLSDYTYPRYTKIQKLHEFIVNFVYFNKVNNENYFPEGFASLVSIIPEITVRFAIGNINSKDKISDIYNLKINESLLDTKLREAPAELYRILLRTNHLQNSLRSNLKALAMLGLIQLIDQPLTQTVDYNCSLSSFLFYVNRHAKIINTTGVWPNQHVDIESLEKSFYFDSFESVQDYWNNVYTISVNTTVESTGRVKKTLFPPLRLQSEVHDWDNGERCGDGLGPCGFDSCFFMEIPRLWHSIYMTISKLKQTVIKKRPRIKIPKKEPTKKPKVPKPKKKPIVREKDICNKDDFGIHKRPHRKRKQTTAVKWENWEDKWLTMCKAAINIMSPISQSGCVQVRNLVAKDILTLRDPKKYLSACHKRMMTLESNQTLGYEKERILNEMRRRRSLVQKYEGLLKKLRIQYGTNMTRYVNEARLKMLELLWIIRQVVNSKMYNQCVPCIAMSFEDFHKSYSIYPSSMKRLHSVYTAVENESEIVTLREAILSTVMMSFKNIVSAETAKKIYAAYSAYPEKNVRIALEILRKCGAIAAKYKLLNSHIHKLSLRDVVQSSYKISGVYQRKWIAKLNSEFPDNLAEIINSEVPQNNVKGAPEVNCLLCELQTCDFLEIISVTIPVITGSSGSIVQEDQLNVIDIEMKYKLKSGTMGWKNKCNMKKFIEHYQHIQPEQYIQSLSRNAVVGESNSEDYSQDKIVSHLREKSDKGATFRELQETCKMTAETLIEKLAELERINIVKRVGFYENLIVLTEFSKPWCIKMDDKFLIPTPWLSLYGDIRYDVFLKWAGVIMNNVFKFPGCSVTYLSEASDSLTTRAVQDICMFLEKCECVTLNITKEAEPNLFSEDDSMPEEYEFNQYESPDSMLVFPVKDSITKYAYVRKQMLEKYKIESLNRGESEKL